MKSYNSVRNGCGSPKGGGAGGGAEPFGSYTFKMQFKVVALITWFFWKKSW